MDTPNEIDPSAKSGEENKLKKLIATTGPELFVMGSNSEVCPIKGSSDSDGNKNAPFTLILEFMTAVMTKEYEEAIRIGEEVLQLEPENKTVQEFLPVLEKLNELSSDSEDTSSSGGSDSGSGDSSSEASEDSNEEEGSESESSSTETSSGDSESESGSSETDTESDAGEKLKKITGLPHSTLDSDELAAMLDKANISK